VLNRIRAFQDSDRAAVIALWRECGLVVPWNSADGDLDRALAGATSTVLVAADEGDRPVGSLVCGDDGHRGWVYYVSVSPAARRSDIGRRLMAAAEDWLRARSVRKVELMVRETNAGVLGFYDALGYQREPVHGLARWLVDDPVADAERLNRP
jgi:ribosomal protein S18 acetylase RimI-like enzyme